MKQGRGYDGFFCILNCNFFDIIDLKENNNKKVTKKDTINPSVIIHPKSIIGFIPLKIKDKKSANCC